MLGQTCPKPLWLSLFCPGHATPVIFDGMFFGQSETLQDPGLPLLQGWIFDALLWAPCTQNITKKHTLASSLMGKGDSEWFSKAPPEVFSHNLPPPNFQVPRGRGQPLGAWHVPSGREQQSGVLRGEAAGLATGLRLPLRASLVNWGELTGLSNGAGEKPKVSPLFYILEPKAWKPLGQKIMAQNLPSVNFRCEVSEPGLKQVIGEDIFFLNPKECDDQPQKYIFS